MQPWLLEFLACPCCRVGALRVDRRDEVCFVDPVNRLEEVLVTGILHCANCQEDFPVLEESPRLLPPSQMSREERAHVTGTAGRPRIGGAAIQRSATDLDRLIEQAIRDDYGHPASGPGLRRLQQDLAYQRRYESSRIYQMAWLRRALAADPRVIVDVGGGRGGNLHAARSAMSFEYGIVADLNPRWPPMFQCGARRLAYIRADATRLPLRERCADLVISSFLLEHVKDWRTVVDEVARVGKAAFIAFGPNRSFPVEFGHLDAPLAHSLPPALGAAAAYLWGRVSGDRRSYGRYAEILGGMSYISSREYYRFCRSRAIPCRSVFDHILREWATGGSSGMRAFLGRRPGLTGRLARFFHRLHLEPNIYSLIGSSPPVAPDNPPAEIGHAAFPTD